MMSARDFEFKQIAFVFTGEGEKISFKNDNLLIADAEGKIKHQSTCYRLFILFICGDYCLTTGLLDRSKKFGFSIVFMTPNLRVTAMLPSKAEGNVLLRKKHEVLRQYLDRERQVLLRAAENLKKADENRAKQRREELSEKVRINQEAMGSIKT